MVARPGRMQSAFTAGELGPYLHDRTQLKYFSTGLQHAENIVVIPQGGFRLRDGLRLVGDLPSNAQKVFPFHASTGAGFDLVFGGDTCEVWSASVKTATLTISGLSTVVSEMTFAQRADTMLLFHESLKSKRIRVTSGGWVVDDLPYENLPNYDYGGTYTNGVSAVWRIEFVGLDASSIFVLTVTGVDTQSIQWDADPFVLATRIQAALNAMPNVDAGTFITYVSAGKFTITFDGAGNEGDGWAVSGRVINKADAAVVSVKQVAGVMPGEPVLSVERGWPQCGVFTQQRLLIGGFKSLPNAWMMSRQADYFNFDPRFTEASGPALVPMDKAGGEKIERMVENLNLLIFTNQAEYWIAERSLSKTEAPNHVQASRNGIRRGVPVIENEGAALWCHRNGSTVGELRYTDVEGNFVPIDTSLLASHLLEGVVDQASRKKQADALDGNLQAIVRSDGKACLVTLLREQEVTAYARMTADTAFRAVACNSRNELSFIADHAGSRSLQRQEAGLLLDEAIDFSFGTPQVAIAGLGRFNGREVWVIAGGNVFGPFVVSGGAVMLPVPTLHATVGTWRPPIVSTLPPPRDVGPNVVLKRKARIHAVHISIVDTTSLAISTNGGPLREVSLHRYGDVLADVPELEQGVTGEIKVSGLVGYSDAPFVTISQLRPGRLNVRSITVETAL